MPTRYIKESARTSKNLDLVSDFSERLFWRLVTTADDYGRFLACPQIVKSACFPLREVLKVFKIEQALTELCLNGLITCYAVGDRRYGEFVNWKKHQGKPRATGSKYPDPPLKSLDLPTSAGICMQPPTDSLGAPDTDTDSDTITNTDLKSSSSSSLHPNPNPEIKNGVVEDRFDRIWSAYPRKVGKQAARKAWEKVNPHPDLDTVLRAIAQQCLCTQWTKDGGQFIPHLATWLNQHRWEDEPMIPPPPLPRKPRSAVELL